jgi:hypothetical protein
MATTIRQSIIDPRDQDEVHRMEQAVDEIFKAAIALEGTISGEHGIGIGKVNYLHWSSGKQGLTRSADQGSLDPGIQLNPGQNGDKGGVIKSIYTSLDSVKEYIIKCHEVWQLPGSFTYLQMNAA